MVTSRDVVDTLWLIRHAQSEGNVADARARASGADRLDLVARDPDMPLSETGCEQARALGQAWAQWRQPPTVVVSSPYERALRTAEIAAAAAGLDLTVSRDERLRERDLGILDGYTKAGIERHFPDEARRRAWVGKFYYRPPGGESWADVAGRVRAVLDSWQQRYAGQRLAVLSHQAVIMSARYVLEGLTEAEILQLDKHEQLPNTGTVHYRFADGEAILTSAGTIAHLSHQDAPVTEEPDATSLAR